MLRIPVGLILLLLTFALGGCSNAEIDHSDAGVQLSSAGRWEEAITEFDEAIRLNPRDVLAYYNRAIAYHNFGEYERAIEDYDKALGFSPRDAFAYNHRADAYHKLGAYQRAVNAYDEALGIFPGLVGAYAGRAVGQLTLQ